MAPTTGTTLLTVTWLMASLATTTVILRLCARILRLGHCKLDDYVMSAAALCNIVYSVAITDGVIHGLGLQMIDFMAENYSLHRVQIDIVISRAPAVVIPWLICISFSQTLLAVICGTHYRTIRWVVYANIASVTVGSIAYLIAIYTRCSERYTTPAGTVVICRPDNVSRILAYLQCAVNGLSNMVLATVPFFFIRNMTMPPKDIKTGAIVLSILGFCCCAASVARAVEIGLLSGSNDNFTHERALLQFTILLENNFLIILCSIPFLRPLLKRELHAALAPTPTPRIMEESTSTPNLVGFPHMVLDQSSLDKQIEMGEALALDSASLEQMRPSLDDSDIPPDRIKVRVAVDVTYRVRQPGEIFETDESLQQKTMFGV